MVDISTQTNPISLLLSGIMENCPEIITVKDINYKYLVFNNAFLNHFKFLKEGEIIGKSIFELIPGKNAIIMKNNIDKSIETGLPQTYVLEENHGDKFKIIKQTSTPLISNGKVKYILSISRDITKDEILMNELIKKNSQLKTLLEYLPVLVYMKNKSKKYILGTKYAKDFVFKGHDRYSNKVIDILKAQKETETEDDYVLKNRKILKKIKTATDTNGQTHWYRTIKAPIIRTDNGIDGLVTITKNIDNEKELENQKDLFIATLVHDLKNPLLAQISSINQCYKGVFGELNDTQKEILSLTLESANYMKEMLYTLINTYKYDNGNIQLNKEKINIENLINTCIKEHLPMSNEQKVKLIYNSSLKKDEKVISADEKQLRRVITNLLSNGINYAYKDTDFNITTEIHNEILEISLENSGPPIDKNTQKHLFEKYISNANKYQKVGFGLGLYLSKKIIEAHNGKIYFIQNGNLNKFVIELPITSSGNSGRVYW